VRECPGFASMLWPIVWGFWNTPCFQRATQARFLAAIARADDGRLGLAQAFARALMSSDVETAPAVAMLECGEGGVTRAIELAERRLAQPSASHERAPL
jgi:hypothetical protein